MVLSLKINRELLREDRLPESSNLYDTTNGVITHCLGKHLNQHKEDHEYPSTYLCYVSIIAKAAVKNNINAYLINLL